MKCGTIGEFRSRTLAKMSQDQVYLEVAKIKAGRVATRNRQHNPPVCHELACSTISHIIPQYRLKSTLLSNSRHSQESELAFCPLPHTYLNRLVCCLKRVAQPHPPVFLLVNNCHLVKLSEFVRHLFGLSSQ